MTAEKIFETIGLGSGLTVCEVGAGSGELTIAAARVVGPSGRVLTSELGENRIKALRNAVEKSGLAHIIVVVGDVTKTNFPDAGCDALFMRDVYHHFTDPASMNRSIAASLKPGARLAIVDFTPPPGKEAARPEERGTDGTHGVAPAAVIKEVKEAGLEPAPGDAAANRWFLLVFVRPK